jgi:phage antirepressor YoqD-like protein
MKGNLSQLKTELELYASASNMTELQVVQKLNDYYFNKKVNENLKLYKKGKKKVSEITKDLKISPRRFYAILEKKKVQHTKYNKTTPELEENI